MNMCFGHILYHCFKLHPFWQIALHLVLILGVSGIVFPRLKMCKIQWQMTQYVSCNVIRIRLVTKKIWKGGLKPKDKIKWEHHRDERKTPKVGVKSGKNLNRGGMGLRKNWQCLMFKMFVCYNSNKEEIDGITCSSGQWTPEPPGGEFCNYCPPLLASENSFLTCSDEFIRNLRIKHNLQCGAICNIHSYIVPYNLETNAFTFTF